MKPNQKQPKPNGKVTNEKPISLPSDFEQTIKDLLSTKPEPKESKQKPIEKKKPGEG